VIDEDIISDDDGWGAVKLLNQPRPTGHAAELEEIEHRVCPTCQGRPGPSSCCCHRFAEIETAYLPGLLCRLNPFERWVLDQLYGHQCGLEDRVWRVRSADEIGLDCGLPASRITEIAAAAVERMRGHGLAAD